MKKRTKIILIVSVVAVLAIASVFGIIFIKYTDPNNKIYDGKYFDMSDTDSVALCKTTGDSGSSIIIESIDINKSFGSMNIDTDVGSDRSKKCDLYKITKDNTCTKLSVPGDFSLFGFGGLDGKIVYAQNCGSLLMVAYYKHTMDEFYNAMSIEGNFRDGDDNYGFLFIDKSTGKIFQRNGLYLSNTYWDYIGTRDVYSSAEYIGTNDGKELFRINLSDEWTAPRGDGTVPQAHGDFQGMKGIYALYVKNGDLVIEPIYEISCTTGTEQHLYKNDVMVMGGSKTTNTTVWFPESEPLSLDKDAIYDCVFENECDGYYCKTVNRTGDIFVTSCEAYQRDGSLVTYTYNAADSYRIASEKTYSGQLYKTVYTDRTEVIIIEKTGKVNAMTIKPDLTYSVEQDIFSDMPVSSQFSTSPHDLIIMFYKNQVYYNQRFWPAVCKPLGAYILDEKMFMVKEGKLIEYDLKNKSYEIIDSSTIGLKTVAGISIDGLNELIVTDNEKILRYHNDSFIEDDGKTTVIYKW